MASQKDITTTYDWIDRIFRRGLGSFGDFTCAFYDGEYSLTYEQAQKNKHELILKSIRFKPGMRVLDVGSGWGPMLKVIQDRGGSAVGITLSPAQAKWCQKNGLEAHLKDWRDLKVGEYGKFDAVISVGAFEHFASKEEFIAGEQDEVYSSFFKLCHELLPPKGRLFLQAMMWGKMPKPEDISMDAPKGSDARLLALLEKFYPGTWPPQGLKQIVKDAKGFKMIYANNGSKDYLQTLKEWSKRTNPLSLHMLPVSLSLLPRLALRYATNRDFRYQIESVVTDQNTRAVFARGIMDHHRMVFEKL